MHKLLPSIFSSSHESHLKYTPWPHLKILICFLPILIPCFLITFARLSFFMAILSSWLVFKLFYKQLKLFWGPINHRILRQTLHQTTQIILGTIKKSTCVKRYICIPKWSFFFGNVWVAFFFHVTFDAKNDQKMLKSVVSKSLLEGSSKLFPQLILLACRGNHDIQYIANKSGGVALSIY